MKRFTTNRRSA